jgi:sec-independent protein translocase protein TatA
VIGAARRGGAGAAAAARRRGGAAARRRGGAAARRRGGAAARDLAAQFEPSRRISRPRTKECPMPNIGPMELVIVLVVALLILGPKRLPGAGRSLGNGIREFKDSISGSGRRDDDRSPAEVTAAEPVEPARAG